MRRAAALLALGLVPLTAAPASAGCVDDYVAGTRTEFSFAQIAGTVEVSGYSVTLHGDWVVNRAGYEVSRVRVLVDCVK